MSASADVLADLRDGPPAGARRFANAADDLDDIALARRAQAGDLNAFETLIRAHSPAVYRVALRMLGDPTDAEDATQDAFLQAWRALDEFRGDSSFGTWIYRIVANGCIKQLTRRRDTVAVPDQLVSQAPGPARAVEARSALEHLERVMLDLAPAHRAPLVLRELEGCTYEQVAEILGISVPAVKSRLHRARLAVIRGMREWA